VASAKPRRPKRRAVAEASPTYSARRLLLDTHVWIWWQRSDRRLGREARERIERADEVVLSAASAWEIAIKSGLGKLTLPPDADVGRELELDGFRLLPISVAHAAAVRQLPPIHRDPFDRMLVAQAGLEGLTIVTSDKVMARYGVAVMAAEI
jgi:PIN domain nuclease of toxin-antitoxin system